MKIKLFFTLTCFLFLLCSKASKKDSLLLLLNKGSSFDTLKVKNLNALARYYLLEENNIEDALKTCEKAIFIAEKSKSPRWLGKSHSLYGYIKSNYTADFKGAVNSYFSALKIFENINAIEEILTVYINLGNTFYQFKEYTNANQYFKKGEEIALANNRKNELATIYLNLGGVNEVLNNDELALEYYEKARKLYIEFQSELDIAILDFDVANIKLKHADKTDSATKKEVIDIFKNTKIIFKKHEIDDYYLSCILSLGKELTHIGKLNEAENFLNEAEKLALKINDYTSLITVYEALATVAGLKGNKTSENEYLRLYIAYNDSLFQENKSKAITEMQTKYETEKKEQENLLLSKENEKKQLGIYFSIGALVLVIGILFMIYRNNVQKSKTNAILAHKNEIIEEQHKSITDSIKYAQRIQGAILPPDKMWDAIFPTSFVLYKPKDILSGDFYWAEETEDWKFVAAADCTGHGVPGALMSIVNYNLLNKAVLEKNLHMPGEILDSVNNLLTLALHQTYQESTVKDGMDITLLSINKKTNEVYFAGANNPIYIIGTNKDKEIRGDKFPVGAFVGETINSFTTHKLDLAKGDRVFLFSDGYADQFGGPKGKKLKYKQMKEKIIETFVMDFPVQKKQLEETFDKWKGNFEQVDDVLVIGIEVV